MNNLESSGETCTTRQAAAALGVALRTAQLWTESGRLRAWKTEGGHRRILVSSVKELLNARNRSAQPVAVDSGSRQYETLRGSAIGADDTDAR